VVSSAVSLSAHEGTRSPQKIVPDRSDEIALHGYELQAHIAPRRDGEVCIHAVRTGRLGLEMHKGHIELATPEVDPR
jgi:hypothetical protein